MLETVIFFFLAGMAVAAGVAILLSTSIVRMAYWLITMLIAVGGLYFLLGAYFVGTIQILVYVGGVAVLLVFGVMLTSRQLAPKMLPGRGEVLWLIVVGFVLLEALTLSILHTRWPQNTMAPANSVGEIGRNLLGEFLGPFELVSVLLLVAMLGAAYLARPKVPTQGPQHTKGTTVP